MPRTTGNTERAEHIAPCPVCDRPADLSIRDPKGYFAYCSTEHRDDHLDSAPSTRDANS